MPKRLTNQDRIDRLTDEIARRLGEQYHAGMAYERANYLTPVKGAPSVHLTEKAWQQKKAQEANRENVAWVYSELASVLQELLEGGEADYK
ncbi:hypothetical protein [Schleiferilactobacillus harbinensis]|uniref:Uncharacterized protein n=1 Tax=Schleiferilactobacillus harbinensis TaxID=304207 RepID=A0A5P8M3J8_9LACO|nr:hypothetical protein [Schleiferilactobacillus harbinensis]QFR23082.1 hypothetical protein D1010_06495 [Schleiferilactobacillus harbinensis]